MALLSQQDAAMQQGIASLEHHVVAMMQAGQTAERINDELRQGYIAGSSTTFQQKVQEWVDNYQAVMRQFEKLASGSSGVKQTLDAAEEEAHMQGGNWGGTSQGVYSALAG
ncbi:hypothetical protein ACF07Y_37020 [Streptomyces sp. NPDC016566]|uniref:hypothetical protein n=1 Tax=Streptomyces sp. NPDC016566 TaxID=3364967 RepID=UPI0036F82BD6